MRSSRSIIFSALALLAIHAIVLRELGLSNAGVLASNLLQVSISGLAAVACFLAGRRRPTIFRKYWNLFGASCALWAIAQIIWTYQDKLNLLDVRGLIPTDPIFFMAFAPFVLMLLLDHQRNTDEVDWQRVLDIAQVVIVTLAAYLYFFYLPGRTETPTQVVDRVLTEVFNLRNAFLALAFFARAILTRSRAMRPLFTRTTIFLFVYSILTGFTNAARLKTNAVTGMWFDLGWSIPFVVAAALAATWTEPEVVDLQPEAAAGVRNVLAVNLLPTLLPLLVLLMSERIARVQLTIASLAMVASFACYSARLVITHSRQLKSAEAFQQSESRFRLLFASNPHPMWVFDPATLAFLEVNQAAIRSYGYSREEFLRMTVLDIRPPEDVMRFKTTMRASDGVSRNYGQWRHRVKDGTVINVAITAQGIQLEGRCGELVIAENISQRIQLEEQLRQSQKMEAVGTLAGGVAHDFNNLLTVISGYTRLLLDTTKDEQHLHQLQQIGRSAERAASLTRQLLAFSRRQVLQPRLMNLNDVVVSMEKMLRRLLGEDVELLTDPGRDLGAIHADPGQIEQIVMNLAVNARDAMPQGGKITFSTRNIELNNELLPNFEMEMRSPACVMLSVRDTGCGMDADTQAHIFEPFFTTKGGGGTGLGLSTVYGIVKQSGGAITVQSAPGKGTLFTIYFPRSRNPAIGTGTDPHITTQHRGTETILLVEDDDGLRELSRKILTMNGYAVLAASRGSEAETITRQFPGEIHLLITDVIMPGMAGPELAERLAPLRPRMKVLYMSGYTANAIAERGVLQPGISFIQKPFSPSSLAGKIRDVLDGAAATTSA